MRTLLYDLRLALRALARSRGFALAALCTLALAIGATSAVFSVVDAALLRPLRIPDADRLVLVWGDTPRSGYEQLPLSLPNVVDVRARARSFEQMAVWAAEPDYQFDLAGECPPQAGGCEPEKVRYAVASASLFQLLRTRPPRGRAFTPDEDRRGAARGVMVSARLWARRFGAEPDVAGASLVLDGTAYPIVGVLPPDFDFVRYPDAPDVWLPMGLDPFVDRGYARGAAGLGVLARLRPGVDAARAQAELTRVAAEVAAAEPYFDTGWSLRVVPLREQYARAVRPALRMMLGTVVVLLLIGWFSVANLLLARATTRTRELALRVALGAGRARVVAQLLTESAALSTLGGAAAALLAAWSVRLPAAAALAAPTAFTPASVGRDDVTLDARVLAFTLLVALATGLVVGLLPALRLSQLQPHAVIGGGERSTAGLTPRRARHALVVAQIALSLMLLVGAGLLLRSYLRLARVDAGFAAENVLVVDLDLSPHRWREPAGAAALVASLLERVDALPGVRVAGASETLPLRGPEQGSDFRVIGRPEPTAADRPTAIYGAVTPGYFAAMGIPVRRGRGITAVDGESAAPVVVINEALARRWFPGEDPIGRRIATSVEALRFDRPDRPPRLDFAGAARTIVGVVGDVRHVGLTDASRPELFVPNAQRPGHRMSVVVRTTGDPLALAGAVRAALRELAPDQPVTAISTMSLRVAETLGAPRARAGLVSLLALVALTLAAVATYGVVAYGVATRRRELGVRIALGAGRGDVARLVMRQGGRLTAAGIAIGLVGAWPGARALGGLVYGVGVRDAVTFAVVPCVMAAVALLASWLPAWRAASIDPATTLRVE